MTSNYDSRGAVLTTTTARPSALPPARSPARPPATSTTTRNECWQFHSALRYSLADGASGLNGELEAPRQDVVLLPGRPVQPEVVFRRARDVESVAGLEPRCPSLRQQTPALRSDVAAAAAAVRQPDARPD